LDTFNKAELAPGPSFSVQDVQQQNEHSISFTISANLTSPFLFLELNNNYESESTSETMGVNANAGWFSDNNFLALANEVYHITYTSVEAIDTKLFQQELQVRSLQSVVTTCD
jgi:hypothetical protein